MRALAIYLAAVFLGGALLAPWLHWLAQLFASSIPSVANAPFHRYVNRSLLLLALAGLWPLFRTLGGTSLRDIGLVSPSGQWKKVLGGFLLGFASLAIMAALVVGSGARHLNESVLETRLPERLFGAIGTAVAVATIEEILFRGGIFGGMRRVLHWVIALASSSAIYALVHFMEPVVFRQPIQWYSGFQVLGRMLAGFLDWQAIIPGFLNLTFAGMLLGAAYHRTGNLYFSLGLHAGWIFWLKFYGYATVAVLNADVWWWGTSRLTDGWLALPVLALTLIVFMRVWTPKPRELRL